MRRRISFLAALILVPSAAGLLLIWLNPPYPISAYYQLRLGMTRAEVEATIGLPPGDYSGIADVPTKMRRFGIPVRRTGPAYDGSETERGEVWYWQEFWIHATYDQTGKAIRFQLSEAKATPYVVRKCLYCRWFGT